MQICGLTVYTVIVGNNSQITQYNMWTAKRNYCARSIHVEYKFQQKKVCTYSTNAACKNGIKNKCYIIRINIKEQSTNHEEYILQIIISLLNCIVTVIRKAAVLIILQQTVPVWKCWVNWCARQKFKYYYIFYIKCRKKFCMF